MAPSYTYQLGTYRSRPYFLTVSVRPDWERIEDFAVTVHYSRPDGSDVTVARVDTSHGDVHFDRLYRRDQPKDFDVELSYPEAERLLRENWRTYARGYERAHDS